jgi:ATP-binding cassette, subfamily B, multidrug efflux pump
MNWSISTTPVPLTRLLRESKSPLAAISLLGAASITLNLGATFLVGRAIDSALGGFDGAGSATRLCVLAALSYAFGGVLWSMQGRLAVRHVHQLSHRVRLEAFALISRSRLVDIDRTGPSEIHGRLVNDVEGLTRSLQSSVMQVANSLILTLALVAVMFVLSPLLAAVTVATVFAGAALTRAITKLAKPRYLAELVSVGALNSGVLEWLGADASTRAMFSAKRHTRALEALASDAQRAGFSAQRLGGQAQPVSLVVSYGGYLLVAVFGVMELRRGNVSVGELQSLLLYSRQLSGPLVQLAALSNLIQAGAASWTRVAELPSLIDPRESDSAPSPRLLSEKRVLRPDVAGISMRSALFSYTKEGPRLQNVSLELVPGGIYFFVGQTGSGKSTLALLAAGLYPPDEGLVELRGRSSAAAPSVGYVPQDAYLVNDSIEANMNLGLPSPLSRSQLDANAELLSLSRLIPLSPNGTVSRRLDTLSIAQRQAISLVRVFSGSHDIVVLDEACGALDIATEAAVLDEFREKFRDSVLIVVSHRVDNVVKGRDQLVRVEAGGVRIEGAA